MKIFILHNILICKSLTEVEFNMLLEFKLCTQIPQKYGYELCAFTTLRPHVVNHILIVYQDRIT